MRSHSARDGIAIARVCGIVARHATLTPVDVAAAVAELHAVTADPHLLGHGWPHDDPPPGYPAFGDPWRERKREILLAAGAVPQPPWWETA